MIKSRHYLGQGFTQRQPARRSTALYAHYRAPGEAKLAEYDGSRVDLQIKKIGLAGDDNSVNVSRFEAGINKRFRAGLSHPIPLMATISIAAEGVNTAA